MTQRHIAICLLCLTASAISGLRDVKAIESVYSGRAKALREAQRIRQAQVTTALEKRRLALEARRLRLAEQKAGARARSQDSEIQQLDIEVRELRQQKEEEQKLALKRLKTKAAFAELVKAAQRNDTGDAIARFNKHTKFQINFCILNSDGSITLTSTNGGNALIPATVIAVLIDKSL